MNPVKFTISGRPITKKNHAQIRRNRRTGKPFISPSDRYKKYEAEAFYYVPRGLQIDVPVNIRALYFMPTHARVDITNLESALMDVLTKYEVITDDNSKIVVSTDGSRVLYDKDNPRTEVKITLVADDIKCFETSLIVCPWCGHLHGNAFDFHNGKEYICAHCGKRFSVKEDFKLIYTTEKVGE